uniref:PPM-type phosphatase domain-containing protein n=1 Tax=Pundamilia nyererei TaxID=303518 RepID=A0A3B4FKX7_9CICH
MQDAHVLLPDMSGCLSTLSRVSYFAVFDGHGGARASGFAAENLHHTLAKKFPTGDAENADKLIKRCLLDTFKQTDEDFLKKASRKADELFVWTGNRRGRTAPRPPASDLSRQCLNLLTLLTQTGHKEETHQTVQPDH